MKFLTLNCTNGSYYETEYDCFITKESSFGTTFWYFMLILSISLFGLITNTISILIFSSFEKKRFFSFLKTVCQIGVMCNVSDLVISVTFFCTVDKIYLYNNGRHFDSEIFSFTLSFLYMYSFSIFCSLEPIYTAYSLYERILIYKIDWPFKGTSPRKIFISKLFLAASVLTNSEFLLFLKLH